MRTVKRNKKRLLVLSGALFMICGMALGYAALSSSIKINGTGTISTNWDILFTSIEEGSSKGAVNNDSRIMGKLAATFDVDLDSPGSYIEYNVTLKNNGNTDAVIAKVAGIVEANKENPTGIQFVLKGLRIGDDLPAGSETTFVVRAEIPVGETRLPSISKSLILAVEVRQKEVDSSGLVTTLSECFVTNTAGDTITGYLCSKNNGNGYSEILDVNIPREVRGKTITKIGTYAFAYNGLTSVTIPDTVTTIADSAFSHNLLQELNLSNSLKRIEKGAFSDNRLSEITIPSSVTYLGPAAFKLNAMPPDQAFIYNRNSDGTEDRSSLNSYAGLERRNVVIPNNITVIGSSSFHSYYISNIELPDQLIKIGEGAFSNNSFSSIMFPSTLKSMGNSIFENTPLTQVEFRGDVPDELGIKIFGKNNRLTSGTIKVPRGMIQHYKSVEKELEITYSASQIWFGSDDANLLDAFYE